MSGSSSDGGSNGEYILIVLEERIAFLPVANKFSLVAVPPPPFFVYWSAFNPVIGGGASVFYWFVVFTLVFCLVVFCPFDMNRPSPFLSPSLLAFMDLFPPLRCY